MVRRGPSSCVSQLLRQTQGEQALGALRMERVERGPRGALRLGL